MAKIVTMTEEEIHAQVTALEVIVVSILAELGNHDPSMVRRIVSRLDSLQVGRAVAVNPFLESVNAALDDTLKDIRDTLASEKRSVHSNDPQ